MLLLSCPLLFFFNDTATTEIYTLSLHDALPIFKAGARVGSEWVMDSGLVAGAVIVVEGMQKVRPGVKVRDRKSTRLNSSHPSISYAVFCLKKKKTKQST